MTKLALKKVLGRAFTTLNSLQTLIVEIEGILNSCPPTTVLKDINDPDRVQSDICVSISSKKCFNRVACPLNVGISKVRITVNILRSHIVGHTNNLLTIQ